MNIKDKKPNNKQYELNRDLKDSIMLSIRSHNRCDTHFHKQIELLYVHSKSIVIELDRQSISLSKGDFVIVHSYCLHRYGDYKLSTVLCVPLKYTNYFNNFKSTDGAYTVIKSSNATKRIFKAVTNVSNYKKMNMYKQDSVFYSVIGEIYDAYKGLVSIKSASSDEISIKIIEYINANFTENINLESLAEHCGYSKNYISTVFNSSFKCNFNDYLNLIRLHAFVEEQSINPSESITYTAEKVGFNSPRTFYNAFKAHYNMTPKEYLSLRR